jgi:hypothetical protein
LFYCNCKLRLLKSINQNQSNQSINSPISSTIQAIDETQHRGRTWKLQDDTEILNSVQDQHEINSLPTGVSDVAIARRYDLVLRPPAADDHDYCVVSNAMELSE